MKELSVIDVARVTGAEHIGPAERLLGGRNVLRVSTDSRDISPGDCFFAIEGENFDGHDFVADAFAKGAVCAVVSRAVAADRFAGKAILKVDDTVKALGRLAADYRRRAGYKVVAITGSVGKTTTREIAYRALSRRFSVHQSPKNYNNFIGVPLTLLGAEARHKIVVAELGTNRPGEIGYLTRIAAPDVAVVTAVAPAHLEGFGDMEELTGEKLSIAEGLGDNGVLIINGDCPQLVEQARPKVRRFLTFGMGTGCDYHAQNVCFRGLGSEFTIGDIDIQLPLAGWGNICNALGAWAICEQFGVRAAEFAEAIKTMPALAMRAEVVHAGAVTVIDDCYNANPASMENALGILAGLSGDERGRKVFICGDMAELGGGAQEYHRQLGLLIKQAKVDLLLAVGKFGQLVCESAAESCKKPESRCFESAGRLCEKLEELIRDGDIVLVKGSRINRLEIVVERIIELFGGGERTSRTISGPRREER